MIRVRTIPEAVRELKAEDPATPINMDVLEQYLSDNCVTAPPMKREVIGWPHC